MLSSRSVGLREAVRELREMSLRKSLRVLYEAHQKEIRDRAAVIDYARKEGMEKGYGEGMEKGYGEGMEKGYGEGRTEGLEENRRLLAEERANTERERQRADRAEAEYQRLRKELELYKKDDRR